MLHEEPMTNGFARIVLVQLNTDEQLNVREHEAIRVAIKALEQQTCEDTISRQAVLGLFAQNADVTRPYSTAWEKIRDLPSVNPQRTGHWIQTQEKDDAEPFILWECSECHKEFRSVVHKVSNYCPSCGSYNGGD